MLTFAGRLRHISIRTKREHFSNIMFMLFIFSLWSRFLRYFSLWLQLWKVNLLMICNLFLLFNNTAGAFCFVFCPFNVRHMEMCANLFHALMIYNFFYHVNDLNFDLILFLVFYFIFLIRLIVLIVNEENKRGNDLEQKTSVCHYVNISGLH